DVANAQVALRATVEGDVLSGLVLVDRRRGVGTVHRVGLPDATDVPTQVVHRAAGRRREAADLDAVAQIQRRVEVVVRLVDPLADRVGDDRRLVAGGVQLVARVLLQRLSAVVQLRHDDGRAGEGRTRGRGRRAHRGGIEAAEQAGDEELPGARGAL